MSRLHVTRTRSNGSPISVFISNAGFSPSRDLSPDFVQRDLISRLDNDNSLPLEPAFGLDSHDFVTAEHQLETMPTDLSLDRRSPATIIRSISSSDGRSIRVMSEWNGNGIEQADDLSTKYHRHARDVSLAAPGSRLQWNLAKRHPTSSATPPSQILKSSDQPYSVQTEFPALVDGHSLISNGRSYQSSNFLETYFSEKRSNATCETNFDNRFNAVSQFDDLSLSSMQQSNYARLPSNENTITECSDTMQDITEFYPEDLSQTKFATIVSGGSGESSQSTGSPVSLTIEHVCLTAFSNGEENLTTDFGDAPPITTFSDDNFQYSSAFERCSKSGQASPFVKFPRAVYSTDLTTSSRHLSGSHQLLHSDANALCDSKISSNPSLEFQKKQQKIIRSPPTRMISKLCPKEQKKRRKFYRKSPTVISHNKLEKFNDDSSVTISRSAFVKPNSLEIENLERKLFSAYRTSDRIKTDPAPNNILVTISHEKRSSSVSDGLEIFSDCANPSIQVNHIPTADVNFATPFVVPEENSTKLTYFQNAMKEVLAEVDRTKDEEIYEITTDESENCYESMKNFWREAQPMTVDQMCTLATGNFTSLGQVTMRGSKYFRFLNYISLAIL